jgi:hypothetical protein
MLRGEEASPMLRPVGLLVMVLAWPGSAAARCPPAQDAAVIAQGGALVTGRIVAVAPPSQARLEVATVHAGAAPAVVRLLGLEAGLYTPRFAIGERHTLVLRTPFGESGVTLCDARQAPAGR